MGRSSPQGLTAFDFHHQSYVNPLDVFPAGSRLRNRASGFRTPIRNGTSSRSPSIYSMERHKYTCCDEDEDDDDTDFHSPKAPNCCVDSEDHDDPTECSDEVRHDSPSAMDCEDCVDDCEDCEEEHQKFNQQKAVITAGDDFLDDCRQCHDQACTQPDCDFSCFDCIDWNEFERDKSLGLSYSVPILGDNAFTIPHPAFDESAMLDFQPSEFNGIQIDPDVVAPPLDIPMHHQCFGNTVPYWNGISQLKVCDGNPIINPQTQQFPLPPFGLEFGCHPATAHQQTVLSAAYSQSITTPALGVSSHIPMISPPPLSPASAEGPLADTKDLLSAVTAPTTSRACQWLMPCGTVCGASFATAADLKKHLKGVHLVKGVVKCCWQSCDSATFASEAALTGHISKKHLAPMMSSTFSTTPLLGDTFTKAGSSVHNVSQPGITAQAAVDCNPFKCTFPGCTKSFMYKQVRDEHVASAHNGNKMYCHICNQFLNGEGSNFKRHMATHRPKHQHMVCKFHGLGCKRRFPRLDNLRRHEACCKFGKKAALLGKSSDGFAEDKAVHHHHVHKHVHAHAPKA